MSKNRTAAIKGLSWAALVAASCALLLHSRYPFTAVWLAWIGGYVFAHLPEPWREL
jgi:hypothetical protein